jgi:uncharacterized protein
MLPVIRWIISLAAGLALPAIPAQAASFDCAKASTEIEKTICSDPALSQADERLAEAFASALTATLNPQGLRSEQEEWLAGRDKLTAVAALRTTYQTRIAALTASVDKWRAVAKDVTAESAQKTCVVPPDAPDGTPCQVEAFGSVEGDTALRYQLQIYKDGDLRLGGGIVVFRATGQRLAPIVAAATDTAYYGEPSLIASPVGRLLVIPGHLDGTGNINIGLVYLYDGSPLRDIDTESWQRDLGRRLPHGWAVWKGIYPRYRTLTASTPIWQTTDGNCCPTAGRADIRLKLQDRHLVIDDLKITKGAEAADSVR